MVCQDGLTCHDAPVDTSAVGARVALENCAVEKRAVLGGNVLATVRSSFAFMAGLSKLTIIRYC